MPSFKVLYQCLLEETEENNDKPHSGLLAFRPRNDFEISQI